MVKLLKTVGLLLLATLFGLQSRAQSGSYWIFLTDKNGVDFDPYEYFDAKAIERRIKNGIPLNDTTDWPLNDSYKQGLANIVDSITGETRWFNAVAVIADREQIEQVKHLPYVKEVEAMQSYATLCSYKKKNESCYNSAEADNHRRQQLEVMGFSEFRKRGIDGSGVRIAIFDGGFPDVNTNEVFRQIREDNRLIATWDFTKNKEFVFYSISHGTMVFSNIGGMEVENEDTAYYGMATGAEYMLAKTEIRTEPFSEEKNWLAAVEWADKNGADIISSSLGYTHQRYFRSDMDGKTSLVTRAGNMAAAKGILVVNAAGNDGTSNWHVLGAPADADSVLTVGGINPEDNFHIGFSSFGPTADGRMKPNVCAYGDAIVVGKENSVQNVQGTSFATPLISGFAACVMQANPDMNNMEIFHLIESLGHLYPYFDYAHGYGVPQAANLFTKDKMQKKPTFSVELDQSILHFKIKEELVKPLGTSRLMYINMQRKDGLLLKYFVLEVHSKSFELSLDDWSELLDKSARINIFFAGFYYSFSVNQ